MPFKHILLAILVTFIWGCNFVFVKIGVHDVPPLFLCAVRFLLASIPMIFFARWPTGSAKLVALYGLVMFGLQFSLVFMGMAVGMTAGMASLLSQTAVFFSIAFAAVFIQEIPTIWQIMGALLSFSGIALTAMHIDSNMTLQSFLLVLASAAALGLGNMITRKLGHVNIISLVSWGSLIAFPPLLVTSLLIEGPERIIYSLQHFSVIALISLLYIVYVSTWAGYGTWSWLLGRYPVSTVVPFTLLIPIFAMFGSIVFLGESFASWKVIASGLVIAGLCVNLLVPRLIARKKNIEFDLDISER